MEATVPAQPEAEKKPEDLAQEEEPEVLSEQEKKALNSINSLDFNSFTKTSSDNKKAPQTKQKAKTSNSKKGQDFFDYAQKNSLDVKIQYEEKDVKEKKNYAQKTNPQGQTGPNNQQQYKPYENKQGGGFNKKNKNKKTKNYNSEGHKQGVNKFDSFPNYSMMYNPYMYQQMARPGKF